ncbi:T9SS type A sorting domain-containing protein [Dyadobacter sp. CY312]|uniref:T9SS type A sorting domain-containing protein n=1 Tax=Dyadobacter sp. CY312 TaxID=2907303 RepID=UPI001F406598|nr:T9SS type A sorting domain-containing protein [Dyadobacter sp. CY312]MCE7042704.1 T9SS type A sorting domain-containing protein [Dyadobacter sp. CY312]
MKKIIVVINFLMVLLAAASTSAQILPILPAPNHQTDHDAMVNGKVTVAGSSEGLPGIVAILSRVESGLDDVPVSYAISNSTGDFMLTGQSGVTYRVTYEYPVAGFSGASGNPSAPLTVIAGANDLEDLVLTRNENTITNCNVSATQATNWTGNIEVAKAQSVNGAVLNSVSVFYSAAVINPKFEITAGPESQTIYSKLDIGASIAIAGPSNRPRLLLETAKSFAGGFEDERITLAPDQKLTYYDISSGHTLNSLLSPAPASYTGTGDVSFSVKADALTSTTSTSGNASFVLTTDAAAGVCLTYTYASNPLPVKLASFSAKAVETENNQLVAVEWATATETNSDYFEIERSIDAKNWDLIGNKAAAAESDQLKRYYFQDNSPVAGKSYYRLKMVDLDGSFAYSRIVSTSLTEDGAVLTIYPNPVAEEVFIQAPQSGSYKNVSIFNSNGHVVYTSPIVSADKGIDVKNLASGIYYVQTTKTDGKVQSKKILVNR